MCYNIRNVIDSYFYTETEVFMSIVYQHDKRSGITYAYESVSYYDKEKKHSRSKRTLIGRVDPVTKEIVPTDGRNKNRSSKDPEKEASSKQLKKLTEENLQLKEQVKSLSKEVARLRALLDIQLSANK